MSTLEKLIIPFLSDSITREDVSEEAGFLHLYTSDINRPYMDDCIFLLYDVETKTKEARLREFKFRSLKEISYSKCIRINNKYYMLYIFPIINKDIERFKNGLRHSSKDGFIKILKFWNGSDEKITEYLMGTLLSYDHTDISVPEEDYIVTLQERRLNKKGEGLVISPPPLFF